MPTNPSSGLTLTEAMTDEALKPRNNGADIPDRATFLSNLAISASAAELSLLEDTPATVTIGLAASATTDGMDITVTAKDAAGTNWEGAA